MLEERELLETEEPEVSDDAFLSGLLDEDAYAGETEDAETDDGDVEPMEEETFDEAELDSEGDTESEEEEVETETGDTNPDTEEELLDLVYNGEKTSLPRSEVIKLAQKGMNYDHIRGQLDGLKNSKTQRQLAQLAEEAGMTPEAYMDAVFSNRKDRRVQEMADIEGIPMEVAKRLYNAEEGLAAYKAQEKQRNDEQKNTKMYEEFIKRYPDVKTEDIPDEVWEQMAQGMDMTTAYTMYDNQRLRDSESSVRAELEQLRKNESNKQKAVGSVRGKKAAIADDAFLSGLFGG